MSYTEWDAAVACNLDLWKWINDEYPNWFKAKVIAFSEDRKLVKLHTEDALATESKRRIARESAKGK
jgi:hypothetical protein